jgi:hypothetical protein
MLRNKRSGEAEWRQWVVKGEWPQVVTRQEFPEFLDRITGCATDELSVAAQHVSVEPSAVFVRLCSGKRLNRDGGLAMPHLQPGPDSRDDYVLQQRVFGTRLATFGHQRFGLLVLASGRKGVRDLCQKRAQGI